VWLRTPPDDRPEESGPVPVEAKRLVNGVLMESPEGRVLTQAELRQLLSCYGIDVWQAFPVEDVESAVRVGERLGWEVVLKATADHLRHRPDLAHVWRGIDDESDMRDGWASLASLISEPERAR